MKSGFREKLISSIISENTYILGVAVFVFLILIGVIVVGIIIKSKTKHEESVKSGWFICERIFYEAFVTGISIFPLLGLFGTVKALLNIDFSSEMANTQAHFFDALTSTAWGIIFAVIFKIVNAVIAPLTERLLEKEDSQSSENGSHFRKKDSQ